MSRDGLIRGVVIRIDPAPDRSWLIIKECSGGNEAYIRNPDTIKRLGLDNKGNKLVLFTYKRNRPIEVEEVEEVEDVELDHSHHLEKPPSGHSTSLLHPSSSS